jgi:ribosomal protein S27E
MLEIKGETRTDYLHLLCGKCGNAVTVESFRWVGGVPQMRATCEHCKQSADLKLTVPTWIKALPPSKAG